MVRMFLKRYFYLPTIITICFLFNHVSMAYPRGTESVVMTSNPAVKVKNLKKIKPIIKKSIAANYYPGAVIVVGYKDQIIYQGVFGNQSILPDIIPMQFNTMFDIASLTKVVATTPAVMQLIEQGKLQLDTPVSYYWPQFGNTPNKANITIRQLLTHTSGLPAILPKTSREYTWQGKEEALEQIITLNKSAAPGSVYIYSDINFIILGHLVELVSKQPLDKYVNLNIFVPLKMEHTTYNPGLNLFPFIAPTEIVEGNLLWGKVHDPTANAMGGVAGNAGLFSTAYDLSLYVRSLVSGRQGILSPNTIAEMTSLQLPASLSAKRGWGWEIDLYPVANHSSYGHTGWTGVLIWVDKTTKAWVILLTSRTHPYPTTKNQLLQDRQKITEIVASSVKRKP